MRARLEVLPRTVASFIEPMECLSVSKLPDGNATEEIKLDGYRAVAVKSSFAYWGLEETFSQLYVRSQGGIRDGQETAKFCKCVE